MRPLPKSSPYPKTQSHPLDRPPHRPMRRRSPLILLMLILLWCVILGVGLARATTSSTPGTVDPIPARLELGQALYLENCATCHLGLPPQIFPTETWRQILNDPRHYGVELTPLVDPTRFLVWNYLQAFSRRLEEGEPIPYNAGDSRYFKALHPRVELPRIVRIGSCVDCHPAAAQFNYRDLTPEWQNAP